MLVCIEMYEMLVLTKMNYVYWLCTGFAQGLQQLVTNCGARVSVPVVPTEITILCYYFNKRQVE